MPGFEWSIFFHMQKARENVRRYSHRHHQRAHIKIVLIAAYGDTSPNKSFTLDIGVDDKATLTAGTDVVWQGTKGEGIFMSTQNPQQYRGHAFVGVENQLTPSAF